VLCRCGFAEAQVLSTLSASDAMVIFSTEPLWAAAFAWFALHEEMSPLGYLGGGVIVAACILSSGALGPSDSAREGEIAISPLPEGGAAGIAHRGAPEVAPDDRWRSELDDGGAKAR